MLTLHTLLLHGTGVGAGGTLVTRGSVGTWLRALAGSAHALTPPAAQEAHAGHTSVCTSGAVTVLTLPVWCALAEATVTDTVPRAEFSLVAQAVEVIALTQLSPHFPKVTAVAHTLATHAVSTAAADSRLRSSGSCRSTAAILRHEVVIAFGTFAMWS